MIRVVAGGVGTPAPAPTPTPTPKPSPDPSPAPNQGLHLTLYATPTYTAITPSGGHREGGTIVTIDGYGFDDLEAGAHVTCQFGHPVCHNAPQPPSSRQYPRQYPRPATDTREPRLGQVDNAAYNPKYTISRPRSVTQTRIVCVSPSTKVSDTR